LHVDASSPGEFPYKYAMTGADPQDVLLAAALVFGLATACQIIAPRLRIPALVLLLPAGFLLGLLAPQLRLDGILGSAFPVAVDLIVAVILFHGGLELSAIPLQKQDRIVVHRLVRYSALITGLGASIGAYFLLGLEWPLAFLLGAFLIVSGPTVVNPILDFVQPRARLRGILMWEGTLLDPIGALIAVVVFQIVKASDATSFVDAIGLFLAGVLTAVIAALLGVVLFILGGLLVRGNRMLGTQVLLGSVVVAAGLADAVTDDSGLLAALLMGFAAPRLAKRFNASLEDSRPFFNTIVSIGIGVLFVSIAALVSWDSIVAIAIPTIALSAILILVVRPIVALVSTGRSGLTRNERIFIGWMDPRGIVAAATASSVGATLIALKVPDAEKLLPATFIVIAVTVTVYSLTAVPLATLLKLRDPSADPSATPASSQK
jgi:NhaP-type Na+/H+ or K+/H+ antiporter